MKKNPSALIKLVLVIIPLLLLTVLMLHVGLLDSPGSQTAMLAHTLDDDHDNSHDRGSLQHGEHDAIFNFVPVAEATHVAVQSGNWFDETTWEDGVIPELNAKVYIPEGNTVRYDQLSNTKIYWIRVDGELVFDESADSRLIVDTLVVHPDGILTIGTTRDSIEGSVDIIFANNGNIDVSKDQSLLSRGLIAHGDVTIHGEEKTVHGKVSRDPMQGDTSVTMKENPDNWRVGDVIVIGGTHYPGYKGGKWVGMDDEVRTITNVSGRTISFTEPLIYNHDSPRSDLKTSVANYTRNVAFRSADGDSTPVHQRGHVMFMHSDDVDVRYAAFWHLGRTDKSRDSLEAGGFSSITPTSNVRGRYSLHLHRTGVNDLDNPIYIVGNAVFGSPGWGYVHHDSNAIMHNNASYAAFGAGFVAETGNETGTWTGNIAIGSQGDQGLHKKFVSTFDNARTGAGFWFQGRQVKARDNIAISNRAGYIFMHRNSPTVTPGGTSMIGSHPDTFDYPEAIATFDKRSDFSDLDDDANLVLASKIPILGFSDNEAIAADLGLQVTKRAPRQNHDIWTEMSDFTAWNVEVGADFTYTGQYIVRDFDIVGDTQGRTQRYKSMRDEGIQMWTNTYKMVVINPRIENMKVGVNLTKNLPADTNLEETDFIFIDPTFVNVDTNITNFDPQYDEVIDGNDIVEDRFDLSLFKPIGNEGRQAVYAGTVTDSIGDRYLPRPDEINGQITTNIIQAEGLAYAAASDGYLEDPEGNKYIIMEHFYSDRFTGEVYKYGDLIQLNPRSEDRIFGPLVSKAGDIDFNSQPPVTKGEAVSARENRDTKIRNVVSNDSDPDGDQIRLDGLMQPRYGQAFQQGNDIIYRPDLDYEGEDIIKYWVTDGQGNYSPAFISINVGGGKPDVIESPDPEPGAGSNNQGSGSDEGGSNTEPEVVDNKVKSRTVKNKGADFTNKTHRLRLKKDETNLMRFLARKEQDLKEDRDYRYPLGLYEFEAEVDPGSTETVTIELDKVYDTSNWIYRKYDILDDTYIDISDQVTYTTSGGVTTITYDVTDDGPLDADDRPGFIKDPAGPAILESTDSSDSENNSGDSSSAGGGGNSSNSGGGSSSSSNNDDQDASQDEIVTNVETNIPVGTTLNTNISFNQPQFNQSSDVRLLEQFLNDFEGESLSVDGVYGSADNEAVKRFQRKYQREILDVWDLDEATGYVGITTRLKVNFLIKGQTAQCPAFTEYNGGLSGVMNSAEIGKTQVILKDLDMYTGPINNVWDSQTNQALITFQETFREVMLDPWNITEGTGYKYKTTNKFLNYFAGCDTGAVNLEGVGVYEGI